MVWEGVNFWHPHPLYHKCNHHLIQGLKLGGVSSAFYIHTCTYILTHTEIKHVYTDTYTYTHAHT